MNNSITKHLYTATRVTILLALLTGIVFPFIVYVLAHLLFPEQAEGSFLHNKDGIIVGSKLIGQNFGKLQYFHPRPSAAGGGYEAIASGGTNLGPTSKKLVEGSDGFLGIKQLAQKYRQENNIADDTLIPVDAVTYSASGLDPHISMQNALLQAPRVARSRHLSVLAVLELSQSPFGSKTIWFFG